MNSGDPCKYAAQTIQASATNMNTANITYTITYSSYGGDTTTTPTNTPYTGTGASLPSCSGLKMYQYDYVTVKAVYPVTPVMYGWASRSLSLTAQSSEMIQ